MLLPQFLRGHSLIGSQVLTLSCSPMHTKMELLKTKTEPAPASLEPQWSQLPSRPVLCSFLRFFRTIPWGEHLHRFPLQYGETEARELSRLSEALS